MWNKTTVGVVIVCIVVAGVVLWNYMPDASPEQENLSENNNTKYDDLMQLIAITSATNYTATTRPNYLPSEMFLGAGNIQGVTAVYPFPEDFYKVRLLYRMGQLPNEANIPANYWKQPEWYTGYESNVVPILIENVNRYGIWCLGTYPSKKGIRIQNITEEGYTFDTYFWIRSAPLIRVPIGVAVTGPIYPPGGELRPNPEYDADGLEVYQNPEETMKYIDITDFGIQEKNSTQLEKEFLLDANYPIYLPDYVKRGKATIHLKGNTPRGKYLVGLTFGAPSVEFTTEQVQGEYNTTDLDEVRVLSESGAKLTAYMDPNIGMACAPKQILFFIEVV